MSIESLMSNTRWHWLLEASDSEMQRGSKGVRGSAIHGVSMRGVRVIKSLTRADGPAASAKLRAFQVPVAKPGMRAALLVQCN